MEPNESPGNIAAWVMKKAAINIIVIAVYNRVDNIKQWLHCWKQCEQDATFVIIHNVDNPEPPLWDIPYITKEIVYIQRPNIGYDIGAFQDVCMNRLPGFPEWDNLLWCTDDTLPMQKDFAFWFWEGLKTNGVVAMEVSPYVRKHIRTTGFAISRTTAEQLIFPADPITTKEHCYAFEHRAKDGSTFLEQIEDMGLTVAMVAPQEKSPLFDFGYTRRLKHREAEHYKTFGRWKDVETVEPANVPLVTFICPAYNAYPFIIHSLQQQTYTNWKLYLIHDGPNETGLKEIIERIDDARVHYEETPTRSENWGHSIRSEWLQKVEGDYVVITNQDNYHVPVFIEYMLKGFNQPNTIATYCSEMIHSYKAWQIIPCSMRRGYVDCAGVMMRLDKVKAVGWNDVTSHSADWFFFDALLRKYGINSFIKIKGCLLSHN